MAKAAIAPDSLQQGIKAPITVTAKSTDAAALLTLAGQGGPRQAAVKKRADTVVALHSGTQQNCIEGSSSRVGLQ